MAIGAFKTITQGIQEYLQDQTFSQPLTVRRGNYLTPEIRLDVATGYLLYVWPFSKISTRASRGDWERNYVVGLSLLKKIEATSSTDDVAGIDDEDLAFALLDEIEESLSTQEELPPNSGFSFMTFSPLGTDVPVVAELMQKGVFAGGLKMMFDSFD